MSLAALWADVRETRRLDAHRKRIKREYVEALRAASPRGSPAGRAAFTVLEWLFKGTLFLLRWGAPLLLVWAASPVNRGGSRSVLHHVILLTLLVERLAVARVRFRPFSVMRSPSRAGLLAWELGRRCALPAWWGAALAVVAWQFGASPALSVALFPVPLVSLVDDARCRLRARVHQKALRGKLPALAVYVGVIGCFAFKSVAKELPTTFVDSAICLIVVLFGAVALIDAFRLADVADVLPGGIETDPVATAGDNGPPRRATGRFAETATPGAGLFSAQRSDLVARMQDASMTGAVAAMLLIAVWAGVPIGVAMQGAAPAATFSWVAICGVFVAFQWNVLRVRHPSRLALWGVPPRALRLYGLGSFLLAVALPVALGAAGSLAWLGAPSPLWLRLYVGVAAAFVLRMGWAGFEIMGRDEGTARRWSLPLRLLAIAAFVAIPTSVGAIPCAVLGVVGLAWLLTHLDAPVWDSDGEDRAVRLRRS